MAVVTAALYPIGQPNCVNLGNGSWSAVLADGQEHLA
jgi:hypothetical protein